MELISAGNASGMGPGNSAVYRERTGDIEPAANPADPPVAGSAMPASFRPRAGFAGPADALRHHVPGSAAAVSRSEHRSYVSVTNDMVIRYSFHIEPS